MNENEEKKFYELSEEERKAKYAENWKKAKPIVKKVLFAIFVIAVCLLMVFAFFGSGFFEKASEDSSAIILRLFK